jgi:hypothetical protein
VRQLRPGALPQGRRTRAPARSERVPAFHSKRPRVFPLSPLTLACTTTLELVPTPTAHGDGGMSARPCPARAGRQAGLRVRLDHNVVPALAVSDALDTVPCAAAEVNCMRALGADGRAYRRVRGVS